MPSHKTNNGVPLRVDDDAIRSTAHHGNVSQHSSSAAASPKRTSHSKRHAGKVASSASTNPGPHHLVHDNLQRQHHVNGVVDVQAAATSASSPNDRFFDDPSNANSFLSLVPKDEVELLREGVVNEKGARTRSPSVGSSGNGRRLGSDRDGGSNANGGNVGGNGSFVAGSSTNSNASENVYANDTNKGQRRHRSSSVSFHEEN